MLCQAILSAVVVTCTLSCIHANGQGTQRLDQIKDLMCVLILSGIQKDDLDPSMLKKLQRHNVNIDDLNNEETQKTCKNFNAEDIQKKIATTLSDYTTVKSKKTSKVHEALNSEVINIHETLINQIQQTEKHIFQDYTKKLVTTTTNNKILQKDEIEYTDGKPKLESVLKFWNSYIKTNNKDPLDVTSQRPDNVEQKIKRNIHKDKNLNESDIVNKVMTNFFLKKIKVDIQSSTQRNVYEEMLSNDDRLSKTYKSNERYRKYSLGNILDKMSNNDHLFDQKDSQYVEIFSQETTPYDPYMSFKDMFAAINQKTAYPFADITFKNTNENQKPAVKNKITNDIYEDTLSRPRNSRPNQPLKESNPTDPRDVIRDIAENIKAIILKDLRKEIQVTSTTSTTTTPTTTSTTKYTTTKINTTTKKDNGIIQESVLSKIMEIFEQMKTLKANPTIIARNDNMHNDLNKTENETRSIQKFIPNLSSGLNPNKLKSFNNKPMIKINTKAFPVYVTTAAYNFGPQVHKFRSIPISRKITKKLSMSQKRVPITIQTNALEIPPLGVYLNNPDNPISQNIIVTTSVPYRLGKNEKYVAYNSVPDTHNEDIALNNRGIGDSLANNHKLKKSNEFDTKSTYCSTHDCSRSHMSKPNDGKKAVYENFQYSSYKDINSNKFREYLSDSTYRKKPINTNRFHEKLERSISEPEVQKPKMFRDCCKAKNMKLNQLYDCCAPRIPSRAQMSLNPTKKVLYDDTHFKNFLKSQQKVTDMLERILAVKNKLRSVEAI